MKRKIYYLSWGNWQIYAEVYHQEFANEISDMLRRQGKTVRINLVETNEKNGEILPPMV